MHAIVGDVNDAFVWRQFKRAYGSVFALCREGVFAEFEGKGLDGSSEVE